MRLEIQPGGSGCGIACVAILAGQTYEAVKQEAKEMLPPLYDGFGRKRGRGESLRTRTCHLRKLLELYELRLGPEVSFPDERPVCLGKFGTYMKTRTGPEKTLL